MDTAQQKKQKPLSFILLICMVLLIVMATGVYLIKSNVAQKNTPTAAKPSCGYDKAVCSFLEKLNMKNSSYTGPITVDIQITKPNQPTQNQQVTLKTDTKNNLHIMSSQNNKTNNELVMIGTTMYMKDLASGAWKEQPNLQTPMLSDFRQKALDQVKKSGSGTIYTYVGTQQCGSYTCLQYEVSPPPQGQAKEYIFFDNHSNLLRKVITVASDNTSTEAAFSYTPLSITPPPLN